MIWLWALMFYGIVVMIFFMVRHYEDRTSGGNVLLALVLAS